MADNQRIDDLRRRVQKDPASIAFAQLAEECRRAAQFQEAVDVCRAGLEIHPAYLSARVTLGRALVELNQLDEAQNELELVLRSAPENLAAIRGLAEIHHRRGSLADALAQYRAALALARNDPDLQQTVAELERAVEPPKPPASADGLSFEQAQHEFLKNLPPPPPPPARARIVVEPIAPAPVASESIAPEPSAETSLAPEPIAAPPIALPPDPISPPPSIDDPAGEPYSLGVGEADALPEAAFEDIADRERATQTIAALEHWLDAIHVARTERGA
jgi:tetratricopeptide (TPR) repeat protein